MLLLGLHPSKTLLRPGEALQAARKSPGAAEAVDGRGLDPAAVFAWRDFMVSDYDDTGQAAWAAGAGIDILRGAAGSTVRAAWRSGEHQRMYRCAATS